jgi:hypothetical protein
MRPDDSGGEEKVEGSPWSVSGVVERSNSEETGVIVREGLRGRLPSLPGLDLPFLIPPRPIRYVLRGRISLSLVGRRAAMGEFLSYLDECGAGFCVNLDDASRGATSINFRVDFLGKPGDGLGVRSLTRRVRDGPGVAGNASRMLFLLADNMRT